MWLTELRLKSAFAHCNLADSALASRTLANSAVASIAMANGTLQCCTQFPLQ